MKKFLNVFSIVIISLFLLAVFGWMVHEIGTKNRKFGFLTEPIKFMYSFPDLFEESVEEVKSLPKTFIPTPADFEPINKLEKDLIALIVYSDEGDKRTIAKINLRNDSILQKWTIKNPLEEVNRIINPILHPDGNLIYNWYYYAKPGMFKIDPEGKVLWTNKKHAVHHAMNLNKDGDLWACTIRRGKSGGTYTLEGDVIYYNDYRITKYDHTTGEIMFDKSISTILRENGLSNYLMKARESNEPLHLNDVQPALKTTAYYNEDDVFISLRNINLIMHYRPSTNELINMIEGPFVHQHDVDFLNDSTLVLFNNNTLRTWDGMKVPSAKKPKDMSDLVSAGTFNCNLVTYRLDTEEFDVIGDSIFKANGIHTVNEGLVEFIDEDTYFIEEQNEGILWVIRKDEIIYKNVLQSQHKAHHHLPNWTRILSYNN